MTRVLYVDYFSDVNHYKRYLTKHPIRDRETEENTGISYYKNGAIDKDLADNNYFIGTKQSLADIIQSLELYNYDASKNLLKILENCPYDYNYIVIDNSFIEKI